MYVSQAITVCPTASCSVFLSQRGFILPVARSLIFIAAFVSLSCHVWHVSHCQRRTDKDIFSTTAPQEEHVFEVLRADTFWKSLPCHADLYSNCLMNSPQLASAMLLARLWFFIIFGICNCSTVIAWFSLSNHGRVFVQYTSKQLWNLIFQTGCRLISPPRLKAGVLRRTW